MVKFGYCITKQARSKQQNNTVEFRAGLGIPTVKVGVLYSYPLLKAPCTKFRRRVLFSWYNNNMIGIYKIKNTANGKTYIGQSTDIEQRWSAHKRELQNGIHKNTLLQNDWDAFGESNFSFEVIKKCRSIKLNEYEKFYIQQYNAFEQGYNRTVGNGRTLIDKRAEDNSKCIVISKSDAINSLCLDCAHLCKQSSKNEIIMCKKIAQNR